MKRSLLIIVTILAACFALGCDQSSMANGGGDSDSFTLTSIEPPANTAVDSSDILTCNFSWTLNALEFLPGVYYVRFVFEGRSAGDFNYPDSLNFTDMHNIKNVRGTSTLEFPLSRIWNDPDIEHPLDVRVELIKKISQTNVVLIDHSSTIHYQQ